jgi:hypothetical protein
MTAAAMRPVMLKCEYRTNPLGIDEGVPRLGTGVGGTKPGTVGLPRPGRSQRGGTGARDLAGNRLDQSPGVAGSQPKVWVFTTKS